MLQRNPHPYQSRRAGVIGACIVSAAATVVASAVAVAPAADGQPSPSRPAAALVETARGSDRHLENLATETAQRRAAGSDRHLENLATETA